MKHRVEAQPRLTLRQEMIEAILLDDVPAGCDSTQARKRVVGVMARGETLYRAFAIVLTTGTFLKALMHTGESKTCGGRAGDQSAEGLSDSLATCGFELARFKTGTPCRLNGRTIDFSQTEPQPGDADPQPFSFATDRVEQEQLSCTSPIPIKRCTI
jgi:tRNA uridine 5-carboxymethylaminomethyl modification enzyme